MTVTAQALAALIADNTPKPKPLLTRPEPARCRACNGVLNPILADGGLHALCQEPDMPTEAAPTVDPVTAWQTPAAPSEPPPSTIGELRTVLIGYDASRPRSMQTRLGPSELGTPCQQQMARKLAGAPTRPITDPTWAPFQGTAVHAEMEHVVAFWNSQLGRERWLAEDELHIDDEIHGHGDAFDTDHGMVVDWKHVGTTALTKLGRAKRMGKEPKDQVSQEYRVQGHLYGLGHERKGRPVRFVRLVLLARSWKYDDSDEWTEAYNPAIVDWALARYYATKDLLTAVDIVNNPEMIIAVPASPSSDACKFCPFRRPGQPSSWDGCAGDVAATDRAIDRFTDGLIVPGGGA
jgi:hypothetical protein